MEDRRKMVILNSDYPMTGDKILFSGSGIDNKVWVRLQDPNGWFTTTAYLTVRQLGKLINDLQELKEEMENAEG